jgi:Holliday junction resolvase RusA-like endonuclease
MMSIAFKHIVAFTVPLVPPSVNHIYAPVIYKGADGYAHRGRKITREAKAYKEAVCIFVRQLKGNTSISPDTDRERRTVQYRVEIEVCLGPKQRGDSDNFAKVAIDSLVSAGVIHSDANVAACEIRVRKDQRHNPRTSYIVSRMENK